LELWAIARYDLGLSFEEFEECTPTMFNALCKRKRIRYKYERLAHALTASAVYNCNRASKDSPIIQPFDFIREVDAAQEEVLLIKSLIKKAIGEAAVKTPRAKLLRIRMNVIASLAKRGRTDGEALFNSVWPTLRPTEADNGR
jgi:hypothetical protein